MEDLYIEQVARLFNDYGFVAPQGGTSLYEKTGGADVFFHPEQFRLLGLDNGELKIRKESNAHIIGRRAFDKLEVGDEIVFILTRGNNGFRAQYWTTKDHFDNVPKATKLEVTQGNLASRLR